MTSYNFDIPINKPPLICANITTDQYGISTVEADNDFELWKGVGYITAKDRLWQLFLNYKVGNGEISSIFGSDYLSVDITTHQFMYTEDELECQYLQLNDRVKMFIEGFIYGVNIRVKEVLENPELIPADFKPVNLMPITYTKYDILRYTLYLTRTASGMSYSFLAQLYNNSLNGSIGKYYCKKQASDIFDDIVGVYNVTKSSWPIIDDGCKNHVSPFNEESSEDESLSDEDCEQKCNNNQNQNQNVIDVKVNKTKKNQKTKAHGKPKNSKKYADHSLKHWEKEIKDRNSLQKMGFPVGIGSHGSCIAGQKTVNGNAICVLTPQSGFAIPSYYYLVKIKSPNIIGIYYFFTGCAPLLFGLHGTRNYQFVLTPQTQYTVSVDALYESMLNIYKIRTVKINVKDAVPVYLDVFRSRNCGFVRDIHVNNCFKALTARTIFIGKQLLFLNTVFNVMYSNSFDELINNFTSCFQGDHFGVNYIGIDSYNNIFACNMGNWQRLPSTVDRRLPQGISGNKRAKTCEYEIMNPIVSFNTPELFYTSWNTPFIQGIPYSVEHAEYSRVEWMHRYLKCHNDFTFENAVDLIHWMNDSNELSLGESYIQNYLSDVFSQYLCKKFFDAVMKFPTDERLFAIEFLKDYNGRWIDGDLNQVVNSHDISDKWILANSWTAQFIRKLLNPVLGKTILRIEKHSCLPFNIGITVNNEATIPTPYVTSLMLRILCLGRCKNKLQYDWLKGRCVDDIIVRALDKALEFLGGMKAMPWGIGKRPIFPYEEFVLGYLYFQKCLNRSSLSIIAENTPYGMKIGYIISSGNSGTILIKDDQYIIDNHLLDLEYAFTYTNLITEIVNICDCFYKKRKCINKAKKEIYCKGNCSFIENRTENECNSIVVYVGHIK